jgi:hypothetical protein
MDMTVFLYGVDDFYTEVFFARSGKPVLVRSFAETALLEPYLRILPMPELPPGISYGNK